MHHLRGTDKIIKKCTEAGSGFSEVITRIVNYIETKEEKKIGIFCTAGHHRSVAVVELLKMYLYKKAQIKHNNIKSK
jgi:RNase adaptor protein for sRNA GlmZ degradation